MSNRITNYLKRSMRIFPLHPLPLTLAAFFITSLGTILIEYGPELPPEAPKWFFKVYSVMITLVAAFYALFAAMKTAENLFFRTAPRSPSRARRLSDRLLSPAPLTPAQTVGIALISYLLTIYAFALIYQSLGAGEPTPFNTKLDLGSSLYFSIVTIATVGYGDILATRSFARAMVSLEILIGIAYHVFFFSIIAGLIRREPTKASKPISHRRFGIPSVRGRRSRG